MRLFGKIPFTKLSRCGADFRSEGAYLRATELLTVRVGSNGNVCFSVLPRMSRSRTNCEQCRATRSLGIWMVVSGGLAKSLTGLSS